MNAWIPFVVAYLLFGWAIARFLVMPLLREEGYADDGLAYGLAIFVTLCGFFSFGIAIILLVERYGRRGIPHLIRRIFG